MLNRIKVSVELVILKLLWPNSFSKQWVVIMWGNPIIKQLLQNLDLLIILKVLINNNFKGEKVV